jgi:multidrug efflux pump subunit AcrA (membrane-fusion protein)
MSSWASEIIATSAATCTLGRTIDGSLEIVSGLNPGDTVVSEGALLLRAAPQD